MVLLHCMLVTNGEQQNEQVSSSRVLQGERSKYFLSQVVYETEINPYTPEAEKKIRRPASVKGGPKKAITNQTSP